MLIFTIPTPTIVLIIAASERLKRSFTLVENLFYGFNISDQIVHLMYGDGVKCFIVVVKINDIFISLRIFYLIEASSMQTILRNSNSILIPNEFDINFIFLSPHFESNLMYYVKNCY